jgi:hypothetical protein
MEDFFNAQPTKPILLDSLYIAAVAVYVVNQAILAWSVNILCRQMLRADKPILFDSLHITAAIYSESSNIGLVG